MSRVVGSLDANVLLRLLLNDIPEQHQVVLKLIQDPSSRFAVADIAIVEVAFVLDRYYGFTRSQISEAIEGLTQLIQINCNRALLERALPIYTRYGKLSFEDCCLAVYAELNNAQPLWTFDQKLANQVAGARLVA